jgi:putative membrane protein
MAAPTRGESVGCHPRWSPDAEAVRITQDGDGLSRGTLEIGPEWAVRSRTREVDHIMADAITTDVTLAVPAIARRRAAVRLQSLNWRLILVRLVTSGLAVTLTVLITPGLSFTGWQIGQFWLVAGVYGLISAFVKPAIQFFSLRFLVASYGLINIVVNGLLLWLLTVVLSELITYDRLWQLIVGGLIVGILGMVLDALAGTNYPVLDRSDKEATS